MRRHAMLLFVLAMIAAAARAGTAEDVLKASGVKGGLVVCVGCDDPALLVSLRADDAYLVQGLDTDPAKVEKARQYIADKKLYGKVSADTFDGKSLPYIENLVNLLILPNAECRLPNDEIVRVLAPRGAALVSPQSAIRIPQSDVVGQWRVFHKPVPDDIDDWTHYLHDPGNNAVAHDTVVGPPRHMQWLGGPRWARHHDHVASMNAMVTESGRLFYIMDEGATASALTPARWRLVARDAFNGVILWKQDIPDWVPTLWPLKAGPANLPRRLVATGGTVYAPLGFTAPVSAIAADSGERLREYDGSANTEEIIVAGDVLLALILTRPIVVTDPSPGNLVEAGKGQVRDGRITKAPLVNFYWNQAQSHRWFDSKRLIKAYQAGSGKLLWESAPSKVMPLSMAADSERVYFHDGEVIVALDRRTGKQAYRTEAVPVRADRMFAFFGPTLVVHDDVIVFAGGEKIGMAWMGWEGKDQGQDSATAFDAKSGKKLWSAPHPYGGYQSPEDVLIADGLVWAADTAVGGHKGPWIGRDLRSGEVKKELPPTVKTGWFHHRCYRAKATDRFMIPSRNGIEYIDINEKNWDINHWVRSGCLYGLMPANGFTYTTPHNCACHPQAKLYGFNALAAEGQRSEVGGQRSEVGGQRSEVRGQRSERLEKGPAYAKATADKPANGSPIPRSAIRNPQSSDWPMYRHNAQRSGCTPAKLGHELAEKWTVSLSDVKLSQAVVSGHLLVTACADTHAVFALDAMSGETRWTHRAGARVDSTPTLHNGTVIFGSRDGRVTCLRASDGELVWRFHAAPADRRMTAFGQVESVWPVNGSVLVQDLPAPSDGGQAGGEAFFTAGRSFFLDGGVRFYRLNARTGEVISEALFDKHQYAGEGELQARGGLDMPVGLPDILGADGDVLFMRSQIMDKNGKRTNDQKNHLFAPYGFVDDAWFHRAYWVFGKDYYGGCGGYTKAGKSFPSGRMIVHDDDNVYVFGRRPSYFRWITEMDYRLFCSSRKPPKKAQPARSGAKTKKRRGPASSINLAWSHEIPMLVRAMGKAGDNLFIAGPPNLVDEAEIVQRLPAADAKAKLAAQDAAYRGEKGALLRVVSTSDGNTLAEYKLGDLPSFDGISIAGGRLYLATETGKIICME
jgi:outer membrane protein assembly factor BamB